MHSSDFRRAMQALAAADIISWPDAYKAAEDYQQQRAEVEREAEEHAARRLGKPFDRLMMASDPLIGIPLFFWAVIVWLVISWLV